MPRLGARKPWSDEEVELVRENLYLSNRVLADKLGRTPNSVRFLRDKLKLGANPVLDWMQHERDYVLATIEDKSAREQAEVLGRSVKAVMNMRTKLKREHGLEVRFKRGIHDDVPDQDLWDFPAGEYTKVVGRLLLEHPDVMECWLHAHGYSSYQITGEDSLGWVTLRCVKEA